MATTKKDIVAKLGAAGIPHDPAASVASLASLLHPEDSVDVSKVKDTPAPKVAPELQAAWDAFLEKARNSRSEVRTQNGVSPRDIFDAQKERGEFDTIPQSFLQDHNVRVAPK